MPRPIEIGINSIVAADREDVWRSISTMTGVNYELRPILVMTRPRDHETLPVEVTPGRVIFASWLLLFGLLPVDRHALALERVDAGFGFIEESTSWLQRRWRHKRTLTTLDSGGCRVVDELVVEPRIGCLRPVTSAVVVRLFTHRHRRLASRFGGGSAHTPSVCT